MADSKILMFDQPRSAGSSIDPGLLALMNQNGGFGNGGNGLWLLFLWMMWASGGNGGWGNGWNDGVNGTGFLANQANQNMGTDLLLQAINGRADAAAQLAQITNNSVETVKTTIGAMQTSIATLAGQVGMSGLEIQNAIALGNAGLSRQLCECCCENRLAIANQTAALQSSLAAHDASVRLQLAQNEAADQLSVCQQTNQLGSQADRNTQTIKDSIAALQTNMTKEFCDIRERELQSTINTQGDMITQLRGQISNDYQTRQIDARFNALENALTTIANKQPNTVPVQWPNLTAINNTPNVGNYGYGYGFPFGNGFGGGIVF